MPECLSYDFFRFLKGPQLALACQKAREGQGNAIALGLLREIAARIGLSGKSL